MSGQDVDTRAAPRSGSVVARVTVPGCKVDCALILEGIRSGELREVDARLAALTLLANDEATQNWFRPVAGRRLAGRDDPALGDYSAEEIADAVAESALRCLLVRASAVDAVRARAASLDL